jgi:hypothetical protein
LSESLSPAQRPRKQARLRNDETSMSCDGHSDDGEENNSIEHEAASRVSHRRIEIEEEDGEGEDNEEKEGLVRNNWVAAADVIALLELKEEDATRLKRDECKVRIDGVDHTIVLMRRKHSAKRAFSWEQVAERLGLSWEGFMEQHYLLGSMRSFVRRDGGTAQDVVFACYAGSLEAGQAMTVKLLRLKERPQLLGSLAEYLPEGRPVRAFFDIDAYFDAGIGLGALGKAEKQLMKDFNTRCKKLFVKLTDREWRAPMVASSNRTKGDVFKISKHVHQPELVFDSMDTLRKLMDFAVQRPEYFEGLKSQKPGGGEPAPVVDAAVYGKGRVFRLPRTLKFGEASTLLHIEGQSGLQEFLIMAQPGGGRTITVETLKERVPGFRDAVHGRDPRVSLHRSAAAGEDAREHPTTEMTDHLNVLFNLQTTRRGWRVEISEDGNVFLRVKNGRCLVSPEHTHSTTYHSAICFVPASGDIKVVCNGSQHDTMRLEDISGAGAHDVIAARDSLRHKLYLSYGKVDGTRLGEEVAHGFNRLLRLPEARPWWQCVINKQDSRHLLLTEGGHIDVTAKVHKTGFVFLPEGPGHIVRFFMGNERQELDKWVEDCFISHCLKEELTLRARVQSRSTAEELNIYVADAMLSQGVSLRGGEIYGRDADHPVILVPDEKSIEDYVRNILSKGPESIRKLAHRARAADYEQIWKKLEVSKGHIVPEAKERACYVFTNGIYDLVTAGGSTLDDLIAGFTPWTELDPDLAPFVPICSFSEEWSPDMFTDKLKSAIFHDVIDFQMADQPEEMGRLLLAHLGRIHLHQAAMHRGHRDGWDTILCITGAAGVGKSLLVKHGIMSIYGEGLAVIGKERAGAGTVAPFEHVLGKKAVMIDEFSENPTDALWSKCGAERWKNMASGQPVESSVMREKSKTVVLDMPIVLMGNVKRMGVEASLKTYDEFKALYRRMLVIPFSKEVPPGAYNADYGKDILTQRGAFAMYAMWEYHKLRTEYPSLLNMGFFNDLIVSRIKTYHPAARFLSYCMAHKDDDPLCDNIVVPAPQGYVPWRDFESAFREFKFKG